MALAIEGAVIVRDYEGDITNQIIYKQRCDACGYIAPQPPIVLLHARRHGNVWLLPRGALCLPLLRQTPGSEARRVSLSLLLDRFKGVGGLVQALLHSCVGFGVIVNRLTTFPEPFFVAHSPGPLV